MDAMRRGLSGAQASRSTENEWGRAVGQQATQGASRDLGVRPSNPSTGAATSMDIGTAGSRRGLSRNSAHIGAHATAVDARASAGVGRDFVDPLLRGGVFVFFVFYQILKLRVPFSTFGRQIN